MKQIILPQIIRHANNLAHNYNAIVQRIENAVVAAVVKDDAYGFGAALATQTLVAQGCRCFFVDYAPTGALVRQYAPDADIYLLQGISVDTIDLAKKHHLIPVLSSYNDYTFWRQNRIDNMRPAINLETGLARLGFRPDDVQKLTPDERAEFGLCMSHLACSSETSHWLNESQRLCFEQGAKLFPNAKRSLSASDALRLKGGFYEDIIRIGANLYGLELFDENRDFLRNTVTIKATVLQIATLPKGSSVSYGATYVADSERKIAIIGIGYGDGFLRVLSNGHGKVFFHGQAAPVLGRVCMENIICDITDLTDPIQEGDYVDILNSQYTADDMGFDAGTISREILSIFGKNKRFHEIILK